MAETSATPRTHFAKHTICLFFEQDQYLEIADALFLAKWAPLWALEQVFNVDTTKLYRIINTIGRNSIVGTTVNGETSRACTRRRTS